VVLAGPSFYRKMIGDIARLCPDGNSTHAAGQQRCQLDLQLSGTFAATVELVSVLSACAAREGGAAAVWRHVSWWLDWLCQASCWAKLLPAVCDSVLSTKAQV
jgi:hypothetical protein